MTLSCVKLTRIAKIPSDRLHEDPFIHVCHVLGRVYHWLPFLLLLHFSFHASHPYMVLCIHMIFRIPKWEKRHFMYLSDWLNLMISGCIYFPTNDIISLWLNGTALYVYICHTCFIHASVDRHLGWLHNSDNYKQCCMNMDVKMSLPYVYNLKVTESGQNTRCYNYVYYVTGL